MSKNDRVSSTTLDEQFVREFHRDGYARVCNLLDAGEVGRYLALYRLFLDRTIDTGHLRADLAGDAGTKPDTAEPERITQIMWPSAVVPPLLDGPLHTRALRIARQLFGHDMAFDFDMLIDKAPHTSAPTPWHQDAAYWVDLPDRRAVSFWVALDTAEIDNGCMWFVPGSHNHPIRPHRQTGGTGALECDVDEHEGIAMPLGPGDATIHSGTTLHYSRGNITDRHRPAFIMNFRPELMIRLEREQGMDHGLKVNTRQIRTRATAARQSIEVV